MDLSLMYTRMNSEVEAHIKTGSLSTPERWAEYNVGKNFLEIPLNLKYKFSIPVVRHIFAPMVYTGPTLALQT